MLDPNTLLMLAALAGPLDSAARTPSATDSVLASVIAPLIRPGDRLRVHTGFGVAEGEAGPVDPAGLYLRRESADMWSQPRIEPIRWTQIERIDIRSRRPGAGAKVGAAIGCLLGLTAALSTSAYAAQYSGYGSGTQLFFAGVVGGIAGACVGGIVGGSVDSVVPSWKLVYERR